MRTIRRRLEHVVRRATHPVRTLPDFLVAGVQKAGTTTAYAQLCTHPSIVPAAWKETRFFDTALYDKGLPTYRARFPSVVRMAWVRQRTGHAITGEATPTYLFHPRAAARARSVVPDARVVVILRDPVSRAISQYAMTRAHHRTEPLPLLDALRAEEERLAPEYARLARGDDPTPAYYRFSYVAKGRYAEQLRPWRDAFGERLLVLPMGELKADAPRFYDRIATFLGVPPHPWRIVRRRLTARIQIEPTAAERAFLESAFAEANEALYDEWGIDFRT
jgi:hypothetical protein